MIDGSYPVGTFFVQHFLAATTGLYVLALMFYADRWAASALKSFRPAMLDDEEYPQLLYRLTNMPARPVLFANLIGGAFGLLQLLQGEAGLHQAKLLTSPLATVSDALLLAFGYGMAATMIYHTVRQLRMVSRIYNTDTRVDLFHLGPLYAFSWLAGRTAIGFSIITYAWSVVVVERLEDTASVITQAFFAVFALVMFLSPLWGVHHLLRDEKERLKGEAAERIKTTITELHTRVDSGDLNGRDALKDTIEGLVAEQNVLDKISTWPWQPETVRVVVGALLAPVVIWLITRGLERLGL